MKQPNDHAGGSERRMPHKEPAIGTATIEAAQKKGGFRRFLRSLGPGLITGASDDDPSGIATYSSAGASFGYATLWTAPASLPLMATVQYICAKIGMVTGIGLAGILRRHYSRWVLYPAMLALFVANTINAGADMSAIAEALRIFLPVPTFALLVPIAGLVIGLQVLGNYRLIANVFKWLTLALFAYIGAGLLARPDAGEVLRGTFIPQLRFSRDFFMMLVAILGTTISPYLFFWQASQEVEEEISAGRVRERQRKGATGGELKAAALDVNVGMAFSNLVFYFIILATAATLHVAGHTQIETAADAAKALEPLAGRASSLLFVLGIVGSGFLAVPILTGASAYALCEAFGWKYGLDAKPRHARQFYAIIVISTLIGVAIPLFGINPMRALFLTAVLNGLLAPPLLILIMLISRNRKIMGERTNVWWIDALGWLTVALMSLAAIGMFVVK